MEGLAPASFLGESVIISLEFRGLKLVPARRSACPTGRRALWHEGVAFPLASEGSAQRNIRRGYGFTRVGAPL